ncbi:MAG TPA: HTTM domain-containing protein [Candidatus Eisenbacteria bacterium]|nr:HTTM domain-containing protein [Candidatus Eisenbacteria bacterium]
MTRNDLRRKLLAPASPLPLAMFRAVFGACMLWTIGYFLRGDRVSSMFTSASFHLTYYGFGWVHPMGQFGMSLLFLALGILAAAVMVGLFARPAALLFALGFGYVFLIDKTNYVNHNYLFVLLSFLLAWTPSGAALSIDALLRNKRVSVPAWAYSLFRFQFGVVYVFAGIAKLNADWLSGKILGGTLAWESGLPVVGRYMKAPWMGAAAAWSGMAIDLLCVPLLLHKKARWPALIAVAAFHIANDRLFTIGMFPWVMLAGTACFFFADVIGRLEAPLPAAVEARPVRSRAGAAALAAYALIQVALPLRHLAYPGDVNWTQEGSTFAWRMMLNEKHASARFFVRDPASGMEWEATGANYLTAKQREKVPEDPDMILQFCHHLADEWREAGFPGVEVRTEALVSVNGRPFMPIADGSVDLAAMPRKLWHERWITPGPAAAP